jgi:glycosyltransferase involved in cell wall biosynthesis
MRIVFLTHYYPPEVNAPASRTAEHCLAWAQAGHEVTVVTCAPNHPAGIVYPGYRNMLYQTEVVGGVKVVRVWTFLASNRGFGRRVLSYISYMVAAAVAVLFMPRADVYISTSPQFFCGLAGFAAKVAKRRPWVLEIRDIWPESIVTVGAMKKGLVTRLLEELESFAYRRADRIVAVTQSFVPHIAERCGEAGKIYVIKNGVDLNLFQRDPAASSVKGAWGFEGRFVAAYVGTHGMAHGLDTILDAADALRHDRRLGFLFVGDGAEHTRLVQRARQMGLENVHFAGQLPKSEMPRIWAATDASLIVLRRSQTFTKVLPSKMFEAMAMERPIVLGVEGEAKALLEDAGAGFAVEPENAHDLAAAIVRLAENPELCRRLGANGSSHVRKHYCRKALAQRYLDIIEALIAPRTAVLGQPPVLRKKEAIS